MGGAWLGRGWGCEEQAADRNRDCQGQKLSVHIQTSGLAGDLQALSRSGSVRLPPLFGGNRTVGTREIVAAAV